MGNRASQTSPVIIESDSNKSKDIIILELFTSLGCQASKDINDYITNAIYYDQQILPLTFHVTYWNDNYYKDPFSLFECTQRQKDYNKNYTSIKKKKLFTPEALVHGKYSMVASDWSRMRDTIDRMREIMSSQRSVRVIVSPYNPSVHVKTSNCPVGHAKIHNLAGNGNSNEENTYSGTDSVTKYSLKQNQADRISDSTMVTPFENENVNTTNNGTSIGDNTKITNNISQISVKTINSSSARSTVPIPKHNSYYTKVITFELDLNLDNNYDFNDELEVLEIHYKISTDTKATGGYNAGTQFKLINTVVLIKSLLKCRLSTISNQQFTIENTDRYSNYGIVIVAQSTYNKFIRGVNYYEWKKTQLHIPNPLASGKKYRSN